MRKLFERLRACTTLQSLPSYEHGTQDPRSTKLPSAGFKHGDTQRKSFERERKVLEVVGLHGQTVLKNSVERHMNDRVFVRQPIERAAGNRSAMIPERLGSYTECSR